MNIGVPSYHEIVVTPKTTTLTVKAEISGTFVTAPGGGMFSVDPIAWEATLYEPQNILTTICNEDKDRYPFGFNGQMKVNEIAGTGNWNTAEFWEYDTRTATRKNLDPVKNASKSPYAVFSGNPIRCSDVNGDIPTPQEAAAMTAHVYGDKKDDILQGGWKVSKRDFGITKNTEDGLKSQVYERTNKDGVTEYTYATAGTEDKIDALQDGEQVLGMSSQYGQSMKNAIQISKTLAKTGEELTFTGHSLGGGEAAANAYATGKNAITFNAAGVSALTSTKNPAAQINAYIMLTDPLNTIQNDNSTQLGRALPDVNGKRYYVMQNDISTIVNGHSMDNMLKIFNLNPKDFAKPKPAEPYDHNVMHNWNDVKREATRWMSW